jgi:hypothetical protein
MQDPSPETLASLREDLEKLVLLEEVAERRQLLVEERLDEAIEAGVTPERIREELRLSKESLERLLKHGAPTLAERLGVSEQTAENLATEVQ